MESLIRPGLSKSGWANRANYTAIGIHPTSETEMSLFLTEARRYTLRLDRFASVNAPWAGGEMVTRPFTFTGQELVINYRTGAPGYVRVEIQEMDDRPAAGCRLEDCPEIIGDEIDRIVAWRGGSDVNRLAGQPVRLRFVMKDADIFSFRFRSQDANE